MTEADTLMVVGEQAWHGLGTVIPETVGPLEALKIAEMDWEVGKEDLYTLPVISNGSHELRWQHKSLDGFQAIIRQDTRECFQVATSGYETFQNREMAELAIEVARASGESAHVETMGSIKGGRQVYCLLRTGEFSIGIGGEDVVQTYGLLSSSHDRSRAVRIHGTTVRVVCNNTLDLAENLAKGAGISLRHTGGLQKGIGKALDTLKAIRESHKQFAGAAKLMADKPLTQRQSMEFFQEVYQRAFGEITVETREKAEKIVKEWFVNMDREEQRAGGSQGTSWAALNSVTYWADHQRTVRKTSVAGATARVASRFFSSGAGSSGDVKSKALSVALGTL